MSALRWTETVAELPERHHEAVKLHLLAIFDIYILLEAITEYSRFLE
jgi:hypothetical protein